MLLINRSSMPVVAKQKPVEQLYEYRVPLRQTPWTCALFDTVTSSIHQRLLIFRTHHQKCTARRKSALSYELKQENQRTEWLKRKYIDSVRQQQTRVDSATSGTRGSGFELMV